MSLYCRLKTTNKGLNKLEILNNRIIDLEVKEEILRGILHYCKESKERGSVVEVFMNRREIDFHLVINDCIYYDLISLTPTKRNVYFKSNPTLSRSTLLSDPKFDQVYILCQTRPMSKEDLVHDFSLDFEAKNQARKETKIMFKEIVDSIDSIISDMKIKELLLDAY